MSYPIQRYSLTWSQKLPSVGEGHTLADEEERKISKKE
jgi:hypothetical protein